MKPKRKVYEIKKYRDYREYLNSAFEMYPDNIAFKVKEKEGKEVRYKDITYSEFKDDINKLGTALINLGFKDKRIAVIGKNSYEWALTYITVLNGVGVTVPLDKGLTEEEIISLLERGKSDCVIFESPYADIMKKIRGSGNNSLREFICMDANLGDGFKTLEEVLEMGRQLLDSGDKKYLEAEINPEIMASIVFTSGTTSSSKAAMLSNKNFVSNIHDIFSIIVIYDTDVYMAFLPFHHTLGSIGLLAMLTQGAEIVFCDGLRYIQQNLKEYQVSAFLCVPLLIESMYKKIMEEIDKQGKTKLIKIMVKICNALLKVGIDIRRKVFKQIIDSLGGKLRFMMSGAAPLDKNVEKGYNDFGILTIQGYGLTETAPVLSGENETAIRYGSCGFPLPSVDIKIDNPNSDGVGEIVARGPNVMIGYYENKEATDEVLKDGWFYTGDLGYFDKDGFLFVTSRKKNVIVLKNGKNIYPEELETLVNSLPYVEESMVYGKPKGDDLLLSVKVVYNEDYIKEKYPGISEEGLKEMIWTDIKGINKQMPTYKHIKNLVVTNEPMIKTTTQKVKRFEEIKKDNV